MIKISNFNFNEQGEIINIKNKLINKIFSFNGENFLNLKELFKYLCENIINQDIDDKSINIQLEHKKNKTKEEIEIFKIKKENDNCVKILTFNEAILDYQPFVEIKDNEVLMNNNLTYNTKLFINNCIKIKK